MNILQKKQLTKQEFITNFLNLGIGLLILGLTLGIAFPNDIINTDGSITFSAFHILFNVVVAILSFIYVALTISKTINITDEDNVSYSFAEQSEDEAKRKTYKSFVWTGLLLLLLILSNNIFKGCKDVYNTSISYTNQYAQVQQEMKTFYDNTWKTYTLKDGIKVENKETFIEVTKILMEGRKDGNQLASKLLVENQEVPFNEFSKFYSDLSQFIEAKRSEYQTLEVKAQIISLKHNTFLQVYPNFIYNIITQRETIKYSPTLTSFQTEKVFKTKLENITPSKNLGF